LFGKIFGVFVWKNFKEIFKKVMRFCIAQCHFYVAQYCSVPFLCIPLQILQLFSGYFIELFQRLFFSLPISRLTYDCLLIKFNCFTEPTSASSTFLFSLGIVVIAVVQYD
jgi:hypothetical protein